MHEKHRERVRERFLKEGIANMPEHNILELILFYCVPRKDTNELAHRLIDTFGSLSGVMDAPAERLRQVNGIGDAAAVFLTLLPQICKYYMQQKETDDKLNIENSEGIMAHVKNLFLGESREVFYMLCFDGKGCIINSIRFESGGITETTVNKRSLVNAALGNNSRSVIFAHNHPDSVAAPSKGDVLATEELVSLFSAVEINVADHIIAGAGELLSMAKTEKFRFMFT